MKDAKTKGAVAAGIVAGTAIGFVTGMLMAPKSGEEIRGDIANKTKEKVGEAKDAISDKTP